MSEKRFVAEQVDVVNEDETEVWDVVFDTENTYAFMVRDTGTASDLCDLLNEQQTTITAQKKGLDEYMDNIIALSKENEQLRQVVEEYRKTNKHLCELCADASKNGYLPPLEDLQ